jgi:uncharacterized membrane protein YqjE
MRKSIVYLLISMFLVILITACGYSRSPEANYRMDKSSVNSEVISYDAEIINLYTIKKSTQSSPNRFYATLQTVNKDRKKIELPQEKFEIFGIGDKVTVIELLVNNKNDPNGKKHW